MTLHNLIQEAKLNKDNVWSSAIESLIEKQNKLCFRWFATTGVSLAFLIYLLVSGTGSVPVLFVGFLMFIFGLANTYAFSASITYPDWLILKESIDLLVKEKHNE